MLFSVHSSAWEAGGRRLPAPTALATARITAGDRLLFYRVWSEKERTSEGTWRRSQMLTPAERQPAVRQVENGVFWARSVRIAVGL